MRTVENMSIGKLSQKPDILVNFEIPTTSLVKKKKRFNSCTLTGLIMLSLNKTMLKFTHETVLGISPLVYLTHECVYVCKQCESANVTHLGVLEESCSAVTPGLSKQADFFKAQRDMKVSQPLFAKTNRSLLL